MAYDTRVLVVDSYATIRRSMRRTAAVVTRVRRDLTKREVDHHPSLTRPLPLALISPTTYLWVSFAFLLAMARPLSFSFSRASRLDIPIIYSLGFLLTSNWYLNWTLVFFSPRFLQIVDFPLLLFQEFTEAQRTLSRRAKGEVERENPVVVTAIRSNNNGSTSVAPVDNRSSTKWDASSLSLKDESFLELVLPL